MKENELIFDRKKHMLYSKGAKKVIINHLKTHFDEDDAMKLWDKVQQTYVSFLSDMPYIGGKNNFQAGPVYDCIALFAYYEAVPVKPGLNEFEEMNNELFIAASESRGFINLNNPIFLRLANSVFSILSKIIKKHENEWVGNYHMEVMPFDPEKGIRYRFTSCPIADFARAHGYTDLMPALCNPDYPLIRIMHGELIRTKTCACDDCCDYWITGSSSKYLQFNPLIKDDKGFLRNRPVFFEKKTDKKL